MDVYKCTYVYTLYLIDMGLNDSLGSFTNLFQHWFQPNYIYFSVGILVVVGGVVVTGGLGVVVGGRGGNWGVGGVRMVMEE